MKRLVLILFVLFSIGVNAQQESHLEFKGIPITGTIDNMVNKLKAQGYELKDIQGLNARLEGIFANEECNILVSATKGGTVYMISVIFNKKDSWYSLKSDYNKFKEQLSKKYNTKPKPIEIFLDPYYEGDGYELQALRKNKCYYVSGYELLSGNVTLALFYEGCVTIMYTDAIGESLNEQEENQSSYDDL